MNSYDKLTRQQAEEQMNLYRKVFTVVRLLDAVDLRLTGNNKTKEYQMGELTIVVAMTTGRRASPVKTVFPEKFIRTGYSGPNWNIKKMIFMK